MILGRKKRRLLRDDSSNVTLIVPLVTRNEKKRAMEEGRGICNFESFQELLQALDIRDGNLRPGDACFRLMLDGSEVYVGPVFFAEKRHGSPESTYTPRRIRTHIPTDHLDRNCCREIDRQARLSSECRNPIRNKCIGHLYRGSSILRG